MITGAVNKDLEASVPIFVQDATGECHQLNATIDTGYNGFLTLSKSTVMKLGLTWLFAQTVRLADGSQQLLHVYGATIDWDGRPPTVEVDETEMALLVGTGMMQGYKLTIDLVDAGSVNLEAIP